MAGEIMWEIMWVIFPIICTIGIIIFTIMDWFS